MRDEIVFESACSGLGEWEIETHQRPEEKH